MQSCLIIISHPQLNLPNMEAVLLPQVAMTHRESSQIHHPGGACSCTSEWRLASGDLARCSLFLMRDRWLLSVSTPAVHHPSVSLQCNNTKQSYDESCGCKVHGPSCRVSPSPRGKALFATWQRWPDGTDGWGLFSLNTNTSVYRIKVWTYSNETHTSFHWVSANTVWLKELCYWF